MGLLIAFFFGFFIQDAICYYGRENQHQTINSDEYYNQYRTYNPGSVSERLTSPRTNTEYGIKVVQTGSVHFPPGHKGVLHIGPDQNKTKYFLSRVDTTVHKFPSRTHRNRSHQNRTHAIYRRNHHHPHHHHNRVLDCVKCPSEQIMIAGKGFDGVLVEQPKLMSCNNRAILNNGYQIETLFGDDFKFLLPHGTHSFHGKIRNKRNLKHEQTCLLKYKVVVQQCGRFYPIDPKIKVKCDLGSIWGSTCYFTCRHGHLSHNKPVICGDSFEWEGDEPECLEESSDNNINDACDFLGIPDNGRFSCQYPTDINHDDFENALTTPNGSICRVRCNRNFEVPKYLEPFSVFRCDNGKWNATVPDLCQQKSRNRY